MADMIVLRVLLALLGGTQILRAEPSPAPTVKSAGNLFPQRQRRIVKFCQISNCEVFKVESDLIIGSQAIRSFKKMGSQSVTWVNAEFMQKVLRSSENDDTIEVMNVTMQPATATGDNYLSDMLRAKVVYSRISSLCKMTEKKSVIIKIPPTTGYLKEVIAELEVFDTEINMMENTLVKMNEMLEEEGCRLSARALYTKNEDPPLIVIEDLSPLGFRMADRQMGLDLEHSINAIRGLARFHATSVAILEKDPKALAIYNKNLVKRNERYENTFKDMFATVAKEILNWQELGSSREYYSQKIAKLSEICDERYTECTTPKDGEFIVLNHGDCWVNNMLFRYNDDGNVIDHVFVDFQLSVLSTAALDILYFTNTSISDDVELHHCDTLIEEYLNILTKSMTRLNCKMKAPGMASLKESLEKYQFFAVFSSCVTLPFMLLEKSEAKSVEEMKQHADSYVNPSYKGLLFRKKMLRRLPAWNAAGTLDL